MCGCVHAGTVAAARYHRPAALRIQKRTETRKRTRGEFARAEYLHVIVKQGSVLRIAHVPTVGVNCQVEVHTPLPPTTIRVVRTAVDKVRANNQTTPNWNKDTLGGR